MIAVVIPAHNEEALLPACLKAVTRASYDPDLAGERVKVFVVLDACTDGSRSVAERFGVEIITADARNVGRARALGATAALAAGARWLAFTDADSTVPPRWLSQQLSHGSEVVCGIIRVEDWSEHRPDIRDRFAAGYVAADGHRHVHGANLGLSAEIYRTAGGFRPLVVHEDATLIAHLQSTGARIAWVSKPCVTTSARRQNRTPGGFAGHLDLLAAAAPNV